MSPQQVVPLLKPTLRTKVSFFTLCHLSLLSLNGRQGLYLGTWRLSGSTVHLNLVDANERLPEPLPPSFSPLISMLERLQVSETSHSHRQHTFPNQVSTVNRQRTRYMFAMRLNLHSRPLGRWNRLNIESYDSVRLETGDVTPVALKHERPFWFSKVRSYLT